MNRNNAKRVIEDLSEKPFICAKDYIATASGFIITVEANTTEQNKQTHNDRINAMTPEEKAEFLATFSVEKIVGEWCTKLCPQRLAGAEECECPYEVKQSIAGWLKSEVNADLLKE